MSACTPAAGRPPWLERWFFGEVPAGRLAAVRVLVCFTALYDLWLYAPVVLHDAAQVSAGQAGRPWTPLYYVQVLGLQPIGLELAQGLLWVGTAALLAGMAGLAARPACALGALVFFWWTGLAYSFGKPHHDKVALAFALLALPWAPVGAAGSVDAWLRARWRGGRGLPGAASAPVSGLPIWITQFSLAVGYAGAGAAKLLLGGPDWFNGYTLQGIMLGHDGALSRTFAASVLACQLQSLGVVAVQVAFPLVFLWPRARWFFLPAATCFHLMTWQTMDTGPYMRVWLLLWVFVPLEQVPAVLRGWLHRRPLGGALALVALAGYLALVAAVASEVLSSALLLALGSLLALAAWRARGTGPA